MSEEIRSLQNPRIKEAQRLLDRRVRKQSGLTRIDGGRELLRALEGGVLPRIVFACEARVQNDEARAALQRCADHGVLVQPVSEAVVDKLTYGDRDDGLCAVIAWHPRALDELVLSSKPLILIVEAIEKPGNLGALLRTADAAGVDAVIACDAVTDPTNPNAIRSSMGTLFTLPIAQATVAEVQDWLTLHGLVAYAAEPTAPTPYFDAELSSPCALVVGAENQGLSPAWRQSPTVPLRIPMAGVSDSLNVSVAAAAILFEAVRQRHEEAGS